MDLINYLPTSQLLKLNFGSDAVEQARVENPSSD